MKRIIAVWLVLIMLMGGMLGIVNLSTDAEDAGIRVLSQSKSGLTAHDPIYIDNNDDFVIGQNGVVNGTGIESDPYIIEGWDINASSAPSRPGGTGGIHIKNTDVYFIIRNCVVHDGKGNENDGIYIESIYPIIYGTIDNVISRSNFHGISLLECRNCRVTNCIAYNNVGGIGLHGGSDNNQITNCTSYNNSVTNIYIIGSNNKVTNCNIYNAGDHGIHLEYSSSENNQITNCNVYNNYAGIFLYYPSNTEVHYCNIYNNTDYGVYGVYTINATNNWWGSVDGPGGVGPGNGDNVSANVLYNPWLTEPVESAGWTPPENIKPTITITSPNQDETVSGTVTIQGTSSDSDGIVQSVEVSIDDNTFATNKLTVSGTTSWSASCNTTQYPDGSHTVYARAHDGTDYSSIDSISVNVKNEEEAKPSEIPWLYIIIVSIIIIVVLAVVGIGIRRRKKASPPEKPVR